MNDSRVEAPIHGSKHVVVLNRSQQRPRNTTNRIRGIPLLGDEATRRRAPRSRFSPSVEGHPTTSSRASLQQVGSLAVALIAGAVTVTFQMACPFPSRYLVRSNQSALSERNQRGVRRLAISSPLSFLTTRQWTKPYMY